MKILNILLYIFILVNFLLLGFLFSETTGRTIYTTEKANITKIIDGDTINTDIGKVRLLGINTPEKNNYGYDEAKYFLSLYENQEVDLIKLKEDKDQYGRLLRYVSFENKLVNEEILRRGLAHLYYYEEDEFIPRLKKAEQEARNFEIGIWTKSKEKCAKCIVLEKLNEVDPGEYVLLKNTCFFSCNLTGWTIKDDATHNTKLDFSIRAQEKKQIDYKGSVWNDAGDALYLRDDSGLLVLWHRY